MNDLFRYKYRISSARLQSWDYANNGLYFITICTADRECFFGDVETPRCIGASLPSVSKNEMRLNHLGKNMFGLQITLSITPIKWREGRFYIK